MSILLVVSLFPFPMSATAYAAPDEQSDILESQQTIATGDADVSPVDADGAPTPDSQLEGAPASAPEPANSADEAPDPSSLSDSAMSEVLEEGNAAGDTAQGGEPEPKAPEAKAPANDPGTEDATREAEEFNANSYISGLELTLKSGGVTKTYELSGSDAIDTSADFPDGLSRSATYLADITIDTKSMLDAQGKYPLVAGDSIVCSMPDLLRGSEGTTSGRLRDSTAEWDGSHNGVGNYTLTKDDSGNNILSITYDDGYIAEKSGKVLSTTVKISGGFDMSGQTEDAFDANLNFGDITVKTKFSKLEIVRDLSIEKAGALDGSGPSVSNSSPYYPRSGGATVDGDGYITYTVTVTAGADNTYKLTNVKVTDLFDADSQSKVDLSTMTLVRVVSDSVDRTSSATPLTDDNGNVNGWNIGDLPIGATATVTYKVKISKSGLSAAARDAKSTGDAAAVTDARTIKNTASAVADSADTVSDDYSTEVKNFITIGKTTGSYDYSTQTQNFTITVSAPTDNRYTEYDVPVYDYLDYALAASYYKESGISSMTVTHSDGTSENVVWGNYSQPDSKSWYATIPEVRPGDKVTIRAFTTVDDSYWTNQVNAGQVGNGLTTRNYAYAGNLDKDGYHAADLNKVYSYSEFKLLKNQLVKNSPNINSDGTVNWLITGNQQGVSATPSDVGGQTITDTLGDNQEFGDDTASVTFYNQDGSIAGRDSIQLTAGSKSFSYTIPAQYGTCGYTISYQSKITDWDSYVGPAKTYSNTVNGWTSQTSERQRVAAMSKTFVKQADDWSEWQTAIYSDLEEGDTYVDTSRNGVYQMYFTPDDLSNITLTIDGIAVDESLYQIDPVESSSTVLGRYASYKITFKGKVSVPEDGKTVVPSYTHPLIVSYRAHMVNPSSGRRDYYNDATLTAGNVSDSDYDYCRRNNSTELVKSVQSSSSGYVTWKVVANYWGYSGQPDGTCTITDTLPKGLAYESAAKLQGAGEIESVTPVANDDGTTTLTIQLSGLGHDEVSKNSPNDSNGSKEFHFSIKTKIVDPEYLYGTVSKTFSYTNKVSELDRYGNLESASATTNIQHVATKKTMDYDDSTAPYAHFTIETNKDKVDLNPDGDTIGIVDVSSKTLSVDIKSIAVVNADTGDAVDFTVDASQMDENRVTVYVPDGMHVKVTYQAQVLGFTGEVVQVDNSASFEGHESASDENTVSRSVSVLRSSGQAESEPMVWFSKRDESANALGNATYTLEKYDESAQQWSTVRTDIVSTGDESLRGVKVESLEINTLYRLVETNPPAGYVLDGTPHYFVLYKDEVPTVEYPADVAADTVFQGPSGSSISAYDKPYTPVRFDKTDEEGARLPGAKFAVYPVSEDGSVGEAPIIDENGHQVVFTSKPDAYSEFSLAPGTYQLKETKAPDGYETAEPLTFTVKGDASRTVTVNGTPVQSGKPDAVVGAVSVADKTKQTSLKAVKIWDDHDDFEQIRPDSATVGLFADWGDGVGAVAVNGLDGNPLIATITAEGPDGQASTDDDWTAVFDSLDVMRGGKAVSYTVKEIDPATNAAVDSDAVLSNGYNVAVSNTDGDAIADAALGYTATVTNSFEPEIASISITKKWIGPAGDFATVKLQQSVDSGATWADVDGGTATLDASNGWTATFSDLHVHVAGEPDAKIVYRVVEDELDGYTASYSVDGTDSDGTVAPVAGKTANVTVTNTNVEKTSVSGTKTWEDDGDHDGLRPDVLMVRLLADGAEIAHEEISPADAEGDDPGKWSYTFDGLYRYDQVSGKEITYTVTEDAVSDYSLSRSDDGLSLVNTYAPGKTSVTVTKSWDDAGDQDGIRPEAVRVQLMADGAPLGDPMELDDSNRWTYTWPDLYANREGSAGQRIDYTVAELDSDGNAIAQGDLGNGYNVSVTGDMERGYTIVNTHEPSKTIFTLTKRWADSSNAGSTRPSAQDFGKWLTITSDADNLDLSTYEPAVTDNGDDTYTISYAGLPEYYAGKRVVYTVSENEGTAKARGYTADRASVNNSDADKAITNTYDAPEPTPPDKQAVMRFPSTGDSPWAAIGVVFAIMAATFTIACIAFWKRRRS